VFFHAHPDDETLLTGGTMARLAAEGDRVVLVVATAGERGLTGGSGDNLGEVRMRELQASAAAPGCARVVGLGYADSGSDGTPPRSGSFAAADVAHAAARLAALLRDEDAELLTIYDPRGAPSRRPHVRRPPGRAPHLRVLGHEIDATAVPIIRSFSSGESTAKSGEVGRRGQGPARTWGSGRSREPSRANPTVAPPPGRFVARTVPPWAWATSRTMASPRPDPGRLRALSAR
jgi:hypothetical protein